MMYVVAIATVSLAILPACFGEWWLTVVLIIGLGLWAYECERMRGGR